MNIVEAKENAQQVFQAMNMTDEQTCRFFNGCIAAINKGAFLHLCTVNAIEARKRFPEVMDELISLGMTAYIGEYGTPIIKPITA